MARPSVAQTVFTVQDLLYALVTGSVSPNHYNLHCLADLQGSETEELASFWLLIPVRQRHRVARGCLEMSRNSPALQFNVFFQYLLTDPEPYVRQLALEGLAVDVDSQMAPTILALLTTETALSVRRTAIRTVGQFLLNGELRSWPGATRRALLAPLLRLLEASHEPLELQCCALESMGYSSDVDAQHVLEDAVVADIEDLRVSALIAMGHSLDRSWEGYVQEAFDDAVLPVKKAALHAAGDLQLKCFLDICLTIVEYEHDIGLCREAIRTLSRIGGAIAYQALLTVVASDDPDLVEAAHTALNEFAATPGPHGGVPDAAWN